MSLFCASHIRERKKDTHKQRERERKECRNCQHRSIAGEKERERENQSGLEKTGEAAQKERERFPREKQKQRRRNAIKRTVFSSESSSLSSFSRKGGG
jgi:hypothetical protein